MKLSREATKTVTVSQDWCQSDLVTRISELSSVSQIHINWNFPHSQPFNYWTGHYSSKKVFYRLISPSVGGKEKERCPTSKKRMQCELREHQEVVPQMSLQSPGEHSSHVACNIFSIPKGNYLRFPVFSFVWHMFLLHFISLSILYSMKSLQKAIYHIILLCAIFMYHQHFEN